MKALAYLAIVLLLGACGSQSSGVTNKEPGLGFYILAEDYPRLYVGAGSPPSSPSYMPLSENPQPRFLYIAPSPAPMQLFPFSKGELAGRAIDFSMESNGERHEISLSSPLPPGTYCFVNDDPNVFESYSETIHCFDAGTSSIKYATGPHVVTYEVGTIGDPDPSNDVTIDVDVSYWVEGEETTTTFSHNLSEKLLWQFDVELPDNSYAQVSAGPTGHKLYCRIILNEEVLVSDDSIGGSKASCGINIGQPRIEN